MTDYLRSWALDDIVVRSGGDGRTVEAYCAMFDSPYEVRDQHGHYMESIDRAAFNRTLKNGGAGRVACLYNHGMTVHGTPDMLGSVPLGTPLEIRPDGRGLLTVTRYNRSELADATLEAIRNGDIRSQSFRGRIFRSSPDRVPRTRRGGELPSVVRHELGLADYGPTPIPVNADAKILAVRSVQQIVDELEHLDDEEREALLEEMARHLPGRHRQASHGNRFHTPGDRGSGVRLHGKSIHDDGHPDGDKGDSSDAEAESKPRTFTNQDVLDILGEKKGRVGEHLQTLKDNGATHEQAVKILQDLFLKVDANPDAGKNGAWTSNDHEYADFTEKHGYGTGGGALRRKVEDDKQAEAEAKREQALRDATPGAIARLLGEDGKPAMVTSKPVRAVIEGMRDHGWSITSADGHGGYRWSSQDGASHLNMSTYGGTPKLYDERHNNISGKKALERVTGSQAESSTLATAAVDTRKPSEVAKPPAGAAAAPTAAAATGPLASMSAEDQQRIRNAVADRGPEIFASPMVGGSRSDVARYLAEGRLTSETLGGRHDWRTVADAVKQVIDENPALVERSPQVAKFDAEARTAQVDAIVEQAQQALKADDLARVTELLDQAYAVDPDHRLVGVGGNRSLGYRLSEIRDRIRERVAKRSRAIADPVGDYITATLALAGLGAEDSPTAGHSGRLAIRRARLRMEMIQKGIRRNGQA